MVWVALLRYSPSRPHALRCRQPDRACPRLPSSMRAHSSSIRRHLLHGRQSRGMLAARPALLRYRNAQPSAFASACISATHSECSIASCLIGISTACAVLEAVAWCAGHLQIAASSRWTAHSGKRALPALGAALVGACPSMEGTFTCKSVPLAQPPRCGAPLSKPKRRCQRCAAAQRATAPIALDSRRARRCPFRHQRRVCVRAQADKSPGDTPGNESNEEDSRPMSYTSKDHDNKKCAVA